MVQEIEEKVCNYFGVEREILVAKNKFRQPSLARGYLWYVLHYDYKMSINTLAKQYGRTVRRVNRVISKIKYLVETQKTYKGHYEKINNM